MDAVVYPAPCPCPEERDSRNHGQLQSNRPVLLGLTFNTPLPPGPDPHHSFPLFQSISTTRSLLDLTQGLLYDHFLLESIPGSHLTTHPESSVIPRSAFTDEPSEPPDSFAVARTCMSVPGCITTSYPPCVVDLY